MDILFQEMDWKLIQKTKAILYWPASTTVKKVQSFIGLYNYYWIFIKDFIKIARPLHKLTSKNVPFLWGSEKQKSFDKLKELFTSAPILKNPDSNKPFIAEIDASNFAVVIILSQKFDGQLHPIAFISTSLTKFQLNYPIYDKELLAIKVALEEWHHYLKGARHPFTIYTEKKILLFLGNLNFFLNDKFVSMNFFLILNLILYIFLVRNLANQIFCLVELIIYLTTLVMFLAVLLTINLLMNPWLTLFWNL